MHDILQWAKMLASCYADAKAEPRFRQFLQERTLGGAMIESARAFGQFLKTEFPENAVRVAAAKLTAAENLILDGARMSPGLRQERLYEALAGAGEGVERFREPDLGLVSGGAFLVGATVHLHLLYKAAQLVPGELGTLRATVADYSGHVQSVVEEMRGQVSQKYVLEAATDSGRPEFWQGSRWRPKRVARKLKRLLVHAVSGEHAPDAESELYEYRVEGQLVGTFEFAEARVRQKHDFSSHVDPTISFLLQTIEEWQEGGMVDSIRQAFERILERPVDPDGITAYRTLLRTGGRERDMIRNLVLSQEHHTRFVKPNPPEQVVRILYNHLLAQPVEPARLNHYRALLVDQGLEAVLDGILGSDEYRKRFGDYQIPGHGRTGGA